MITTKKIARKSEERFAGLVASDITGSETVAQLVERFGALTKDGEEVQLVLSLTIKSSESQVKAGANVSKADMDLALAQLTQAEIAAVSKFQLLASKEAVKRTEGKTSPRVKLEAIAQSL